MRVVPGSKIAVGNVTAAVFRDALFRQAALPKSLSQEWKRPEFHARQKDPLARRWISLYLEQIR
jgi:hypothetical protein